MRLGGAGGNQPFRPFYAQRATHYKTENLRGDHLHFLHFEALLATDKISFEALHEAMSGRSSLESLACSYEMREYLGILHHNRSLHEQITQVLSLYNTSFIRSNNVENLIYIKLQALSRKLFPAINSEILLSSLFSAFFVQALVGLAHEGFIEGGHLWKSRYGVIGQVRQLLKQFLLQLELVTGNYIKMEHETKTLIWVLLQTLINHGTLVSKTKFTAKNKSEVFVAGAEVIHILSSGGVLKVFKKPAQTLVIRDVLFLQAPHFSLLKPVLHKNMASTKRPQLNNLTFLHSRLNMKVYINWDLFDIIVDLASKYFIVDVLNPEALGAYLKTFKLSWWDNQAKAKYSQAYKLVYLLALNRRRADLKDGLYFHYYFDFRGRVYADSPISYTFNKTTRWLFYYGIYTDAELEQARKDTPEVDPILINLICTQTPLKQNYAFLDFTDKLTQHYIVTVFFELGKLKKTSGLADGGGRLDTGAFLALGIHYFNNPPTKEVEFEDHIEYLAIVAILESLRGAIFKKIPIYKDATASALQLLTILLGPATLQILNEVNLKNSGFWYDTYYAIIERFYSTTKVPAGLKTKYFTRGALKKTIMTHNYQATYLTCLNEFKTFHGLPWDDQLEPNTEVVPIFKEFYNYLETLFNSKMYFAASSDSIVTWFKQVWLKDHQLHFITLDKLYIPLEYVKLTKQRVERIVLARRETILWSELSQDFDELKMFRAIRANIIHSFDGYLVRQVTLRLGYPIITIHDSFGIDVLNIADIIKITQAELEKLIALKLFTNENASTLVWHVDSPYVLL